MPTCLHSTNFDCILVQQKIEMEVKFLQIKILQKLRFVPFRVIIVSLNEYRISIFLKVQEITGTLTLK